MMAVVDRVVDVAGLEIHYRETGWPDGIPVIALHGHPGSASTWDEVATGLCAGGRYRFLAVTQRGYAPSGRAATYSFEAFRDDVFAFADALELGSFVLVGHSMGGTVATLAGEAAPDRLLALVLEDSVPPREGLDLPVPTRPDRDLPYDWELVPAVFGQLATPDPVWWARLSQITVPTLVLAGGSTSHVPQGLLAEAARRIPQSCLITLDGAGHTAHRTQPERFIAEVSKFLSDVVSSS